MVIVQRVVLGAAVVPERNGMGFPLEAGGPFFLDAVPVQVIQDRIAFVLGDVVDADREGRVHIEKLAAAFRVGRHHGMDRVGRAFAKLLGAKVYLPDYRLAPEHPFPLSIDDTLQAYRWLLDQGNDPKSIVFSGDSAGGPLVVSVVVKARHAGLPLPAGGAALSPWANLEHTGASIDNRDGLDPQASRIGLTLLAKAFLNGALPNDPDASPVFADVRGLPPILVQIGENEVMLSDAMRLATHLGENRVRVSLEVWPGMFHVWHLFAAILPEGMRAVENAALFLEQAMRVKD